MQDKRARLSDAIAAIPDGAVLALGGNTIHRGPGAAVHEIVRQRKSGLNIVKTAGAYDIDLLCATGCASVISAGYVGYESVLGLAPSYRRAVETGLVRADEHACYTVIAGLRATIQGVPFMPVAGLTGSDLPDARGFQWVSDPYSGEQVVAIPPIAPDVAIVHVHEADRFGNAVIHGTRFEDVLMVQAAKRVILTAERVVDGAGFAEHPDFTTISSLYVTDVVEAPGGAWPFGCAGLYEPDLAYLQEFVAASAGEDAIAAFVAERLLEAAPA